MIDDSRGTKFTTNPKSYITEGIIKYIHNYTFRFH